MLNNPFRAAVRRIQCSRRLVLQAVSFVLIAGMALQAAAAGERTIKSRVAPVYPEVAKRLKITGIVVIEASVDADGKVTEVKTVSGNRMLSIAAEEAVSKWKFVPGPKNTTESVAINFHLAE